MPADYGLIDLACCCGYVPADIIVTTPNLHGEIHDVKKTHKKFPVSGIEAKRREEKLYPWATGFAKNLFKGVFSGPI